MDTSKRLAAVQSPIIPLIGRLTRDNPGTISFGQGVAFYGPPSESFQKVRHFMDDPIINLYGPVEGIAEFHDALTMKLQKQNGIHINSENKIVVTAGSNMAFNTAILATTDPGDEVIIPIPYYFNHEMSLVMEKCKPVFVQTDGKFHLVLDKIEASISDKTKAIVTISPNNPSGAVYSKQELIAVNELCKKHNLFHISDEAYEDFYYDQHQHYSVASDGSTSDYTLSLFSFSKGYGFAGWRIGYMVIPTHLLNAVKKIQDTILISPPIISQFAAIGALEAGDSFIQSKREAMSKKRDMLLNELSDLSCLIDSPLSEGAFYTLLSINSEKNDMHLAQSLIEDYGIATIPGTAFGIKDGCFLRLSYGALSDEDIIEGANRLRKGLKNI